MYVPLLSPPTYHPFLSGTYDVKAGLHRFGKDFGNGPHDQRLFQRDHVRYAAAKRAALARDRGRYYATHAFDDLVSLVQEDACVVRVEDARDWVAAAHVCFPNVWAARHKVGLSFADVHEPIAHEHEHTHDDHHQHAHAPGTATGEPHTHAHRHAPLRHEHAHFPDAHHRHGHG